MLPSPCDRVCTLDTDVNGEDRCVSCLRLPSELAWDALSEAKQEKILSRDVQAYFPDREETVSDIEYPKNDTP